MTDTLNLDPKGDLPFKQSPSSSGLSSFAGSRFSKTESSDSSMTRKLRILMNKVSDNNFQKLLDEVIQNQVFDEKLISEFLKLVFERVASRNSSDLFTDVLSYFSHRLEVNDMQAFDTLKRLLKQKIKVSGLHQWTANCIGFVTGLYKEKLISLKTISKLLSTESIEAHSEKTIENLCLLLETAGPYLCKTLENSLEKSFDYLSQFNTQNLSKKIQFLIVNTLDQKPKFLTPAPEYIPKYSNSFSVKHSGKKVSFSDIQDFVPVISNKTKRILKHTVSEESKIALKLCVSDYVKGKKDLEKLKNLFEVCKNQERQLVYQIFKYALIQFSREQEFGVICEMVNDAVEKFLNKYIIETGVAHTVEAIGDIKLDTPLAAGYLKTMIENLKEKGIVENSDYLIEHLMRPDEGKILE